MYQAKEAQRPASSVYDAARDDRQPRARLALVGELRTRDRATSELVLHYQPKVDLRDRRGASASRRCVRWHHPTRGLVPPDEFIPLAEQTGLIEPLDAWVLDAALRAVRAVARATACELAVAVNLSARTCSTRDLPDRGRGAAARSTACRAALLELEITETHDRRPTRPARCAILDAAARRSASRSRSTTSAPATRRWPTSSACRSTSSRSTARS